jgi:hypothetical protein
MIAIECYVAEKAPAPGVVESCCGVDASWRLLLESEQAAVGCGVKLIDCNVSNLPTGSNQRLWCSYKSVHAMESFAVTMYLGRDAWGSVAVQPDIKSPA